MTDTRTLGQRRIDVSFNPGGMDDITAIKDTAAAFIDLVDAIVSKRKEALSEDESKSQVIADMARLQALALTAAEQAAMWAVKAATRS